MGLRHGPEEIADPTYFVCTLGQAAAINVKTPHSWDTVNSFIDHQAQQYPDRPAVAFPLPPDRQSLGPEWDLIVYSMCFYCCRTSATDLLAQHSRTLSGTPSLQADKPQCQPPAIAHLCEQCGISTLIFDRMYQDLADRSCEMIRQSTRFILVPLPDNLIDKSNRHDSVSSDNSPPIELWSVTSSDVAYLHHTSGTSTGLPKPIPQSHHAAVGVLPGLNDHQVGATFTTTPLYHGGVADCFRAWTSGALIWLFPGHKVPITASTILKSLKCARRATGKNHTPRVTYFSSVPFVLQMMSEESEGLEVLRGMDIVGVGGAALPPDIGNSLVSQGVNLISRFGSAECGFLMSSHRQYNHDREWQYLRPNQSPHLSFELQYDGLSELIIRPSWPHMAKRNRDDGSYATADLFQPHPMIPDAWRYHSRADSQLTFATGKKFDPAPLEAAIATSSMLSDVLIFGNGEQYPGALLFRSKESADKPSQDLIHAVWPLIEKLNAESQSHTRLSPSMLTVMPKDALNLEKSSKGTIMRGSAEKRYATKISEAYTNGLSVKSTTSSERQTASVPDDSVPGTVLQIIKEITGTGDRIPEDADLYSYGVDSVACMRIRALLYHKILSPNPIKLPLNIVYDCGTIAKLSKYLVTIRKGGNYEGEDDISQMQAYVSKYSRFNDALDPPSEAINSTTDVLSKEHSIGEIIVLTGSTGALGAHILAQLRSSSRVSEIHCLVRATSATAAIERVSKSLLARKKAPLDPKTGAKVTCHPCKLSDSSLSLTIQSANLDGNDIDLYETLANRTTVIIHAAWAVNFTTRLSSFEKDHIAGLYNLINFALSSNAILPPRFLFCSSTASVLGPHAKSRIPETFSHDANDASPLGYSRSKWVAEAVCEQAHLNTRLRDQVSVLRIGQLCGDTESGIWNVTEAWPLMLSSMKITGSLPDLKDSLGWLPVDVAAEAVVQLALSDARNLATRGLSTDAHLFHILNPNTRPKWSDLVHWLQRLSPGFRIIPAPDWVSELDDLKGQAARHPARKLLGLWKESYSGGKEDTGHEVIFEMQNTEKAISVMRDVQPIDERQFGKIWAWIEKEMMDGQEEE